MVGLLNCVRAHFSVWRVKDFASPVTSKGRVTFAEREYRESNVLLIKIEFVVKMLDHGWYPARSRSFSRLYRISYRRVWKHHLTLEQYVRLQELDSKYRKMMHHKMYLMRATA